MARKSKGPSARDRAEIRAGTASAADRAEVYGKKHSAKNASKRGKKSRKLK